MGNGVFQIIHGAVPVGIKGETHNIIIDFFYLQPGKQRIQFLHIINIRVMYSNENFFAGIRCRFPDGFAACGQKFSDICHIRLTGHTVVDLVTDLYHTHIHTGIQKLCQAFQSEVIESIGLFFNIHAFPCLGNKLLLGVGPEIGIMEINADLHAIFRGTLSQSDGGRHVIIAAAVTVAVLVIGIIPDPETDIVHTGLCQCHKNILFFPIKIIIFHAAVLQSQHGRSVHTTVKVIGNAVDRLDKNGRLLRNLRQGKSGDIRHPGRSGIPRCYKGIGTSGVLSLIAAARETSQHKPHTESQSQQARAELLFVKMLHK